MRPLATRNRELLAVDEDVLGNVLGIVPEIAAHGHNLGPVVGREATVRLQCPTFVLETELVVEREIATLDRELTTGQNRAVCLRRVRTDPHGNRPLRRRLSSLPRNTQVLRAAVEGQRPFGERTQRVDWIAGVAQRITRGGVTAVVIDPGDFLTVGQAVIIRVGLVRQRGGFLLLQVRQTVAVEITVAVINAVRVGLALGRIQAGKVLVVVIQPV